MKEFKLITMTDFVLEKAKEKFNNGEYPVFDYHKITWNYAKFLKQPLKLEMFVPCDQEGEALIYPNQIPRTSMTNYEALGKYEDKFKAAEEKVLFENFYFKKQLTAFGVENFYRFNYNGRIFNLDIGNKNIEYLIQYNLTLTHNAIKQIGL